ncbi:hypothetical protein [Saccharopolyspora sp. CA-218241]|uniref:hypothetical protein n=1 Tax=Saccharopolyspora sp. CA-218241 TaxID=3240027 RepID=UPI003D961C48
MIWCVLTIAVLAALGAAPALRRRVLRERAVARVRAELARRPLRAGNRTEVLWPTLNRCPSRERSPTR